MRVLVTGANGQLGTAVQACAPADWSIIATDVDDLDITDGAAVQKALADVDVCINAAAYTAVDAAESDEEAARRVNVDACRHLAQACLDQGALLIHVSTDYVFDGDTNTAYVETDATNPRSAYGRTKLGGEAVIRAAGVDHIILRTSWLYGATGHNFMKTMLRLGRERDHLTVVVDQIGTPTLVDDLAAVIVHVLGRDDVRNQTGTYHFSNEGVASWYDFARAIHRAAGIDCHIDPVPTSAFPTPAERPRFTVLDKTRIKQTFGLTIDHWQDALVRCLKSLDA